MLTAMSGSSTPAGWYPDPTVPGQQRYWDGNSWTDNTAPGPAEAPTAPPAPPPGGYAPPMGGYAAPTGGYAPPMGAYGAPTQVGYGYTQVGAAPMAGFGIRLVSYLIDVIPLGIVIAIIATVLGVDSTNDNGGINPGYQLLSWLLMLPYFVYFEGSSGQTIGKKLMNIQVVDAGSLQPGIGTGRAVGRYFGRILSSIPCGLGYLWMLWDGEKQTWHDKLATTKVVKV
jgi:uncharacterized RDD family membrane protein YckC